MIAGFIYVLQNKAFGAYVVKIGVTTREPDTRARELYVGSSGVPLPFDIAIAYSVGDCRLAEKRIHKRLAAYRLNGRREFFRISPSIAATLVYETCAMVNAELGVSTPSPFTFTGSVAKSKTKDNVVDVNPDPSDGKEVVLIALQNLRNSPIRTSTLSPEQLDRVHILGMLLAKVHPNTYEMWHEGFSRDENPERELRIWEHITKAYLTIDEIEVASEGLKTEAFALLLSRSWSAADVVLQNMTLKHFTTSTAKRLMRAYELRPKPILVRNGPNAG